MNIYISPYDQNWPGAFEAEREQLAKLLAGWNPLIEHIGSTAVEGLGAKPIIDILIGVSVDGKVLSEVIHPLIEAGYCYFPCYEKQLPERCFLARIKGLASATFSEEQDLPDRLAHPHTHHLHLVAHGSPFWKRHLAFRDYLRTHPMARDAYHRMKLKLAEGSWESVDDYAQAKSAFIRRMEWLI